MGRPKPFLPLGDSSFLETILSRLGEAGLDHCIVIANPEQAELYANRELAGARVIYNPAVQLGQFESMRLAVRHAPPHCQWLLLTPVDIPAISAASYRVVAEACQSAPADAIAVAAFRGEWGHPLALPRGLFRTFLDWDGPMGARGFLERHASRVSPVETGDRAILRDADTPEEYDRLVRNFPTPCLPPETDLS